ncbi:MAG: hypothetical protein A2542_01250 [Parcubacteria group bacterium RIFOXYD2_FULL_52_8]|nr:MAG: hypothetical protein A2542_01250 [Parcubacteria group bacterium RIFOXYD2_FULL_52_8]
MAAHASSLVCAEAKEFLQKNHTAVVASVYRKYVAASTVYYVLDDDLNFFFATRKGTDKYLNFSDNANVALVVGTGPKHISVQVRGHVERLHGEPRAAALERLTQMKQHKKITTWPIKDMVRFHVIEKKTEEVEIVFRVTPQQLVFMNLDDPHYPASHSSAYHTILPRTRVKSASL